MHNDPRQSPACRPDSVADSRPSARLPRRDFLRQLAVGSGALLAPDLLIRRATAAENEPHARGLVFDETSGNGLAGIPVSNGRDITLTDERGEWSLPTLADAPSTDFFVMPTRGWTTPVSGDACRLAHYTHHPEGSPAQRYPGFKPTGALPERIRLPLIEQEQADRFKIVVCGDPQPRDLREVDFIARSAPQEIAREQAAFAVALGDIMFDDLGLFPALRGALAASGLPWHYVVGNHDLNFDAPDHTHSRETYRHQFGPTTYAFDHGPVHFIVVDNVEWEGARADQPGGTGFYRGFIQDRDLEFIANDLARVPVDTLVVLFMHIPLLNPYSGTHQTQNRAKLYELIKDRPYTLSFSAHTHWHHHVMVGEEDGFGGDRPHHHVISGTLCGSWFRGAPDMDMIPQAVMSDGTPRGYQVVEFDGNRHVIDGYKVIGGDRGRQLHITMADEVEAAKSDAPYHINLYSAGPAALVKTRIAGGGEWRELVRVGQADPLMERLHERDADLKRPWYPLPRPSICPHLWAGRLPEGLEPGTHVLEISAHDGFGHERHDVRPFRVV